MKKGWIVGAVVIVVGAVAYNVLKKGNAEAEIEFKYEPLARGELMRSTSATGVLVALTTVDVKSKAGGKVVKLAVEEGTVVKKGDLIALIDPSDTQAAFSQAEADLTSATAKADQARINFELQKASTQTAIANGKTNLEAAHIKLERTRMQTKRQPALTASARASAKAAYDASLADLKKLLNVTIPQSRRDVQGSFDQANASLDAAKAEYARQIELNKKGYVSKASVEKALSSLEAAKSSFETAKQRRDTLDQDIEVLKQSQDLAVKRAKASYDQAEASASDVEIAKQNLAEAETSYETARIALQQAIDNARNNNVREKDIQSALASTVRSRVSKDNAKVQLDSTTVLAPRDGVVTTKYLEEGTIIPPGTSTFAQGTSLVQISDTTTMFADCTVSEVDISSIKEGMKVRTILEAYPGDALDGVVVKVSPAAVTNNNMTTIKVRVKVLPSKNPSVKLLPGMNANCEFIQLSKPNTLLLPQQALKREDGKTTVRIMTADKLKPKTVEVTVGEMGNDAIELVSGLKEGDEVVVAEINLAEMRDVQKKMQEAQQGGGLTGGGPPRRNQQQARPTRGGGAGGGGR